MKQVLFKQGRAVVDDVPAPGIERGTAIVRVEYSCISTGTELSGIKSSGQPLWKRALQNPQAVFKVMQLAATEGIGYAASAVQSAVSIGQATGYSAAGIVAEVGTGINDLYPGQRVACAGAQCAFHAEYIRVPSNLVVEIPDSVGMADASTVALGAIALQGIRRCAPTLGETIVVVGLGLLGQLVCQMLRANGCRVIAVEPNRARREIARHIGAEILIDPTGDSDLQQVARLTEGNGADGVVITAATPSDEVVSAAFRMCRKKGRVVLVGDVGLNLRRADIYEKELDFLVSTSYGPGRYDRKYESEGLDYPLGYVRWTENRNMQEYLRLISDGKVQVQPLVGGIMPVDRAGEAYDSLQAGEPVNRPLLVLLQYPSPPSARATRLRVAHNPSSASARSGPIRLAVIGGGNFATGTHLPNIRTLSELFSVQAIVSRTGHKASALAQQFGAHYATTDVDEVLRDNDVDAVLISTRHDSHAPLALRALQAGKHVLLEKPLALTDAELMQLQEFFECQAPNGQTPILLTGFNRRFSPHAQRLRELTQHRSHPMIVNYRMNAGYLPPDHWVHGEEGGGRNLGEACHVYDFFVFLTDSPVKSVTAAAIGGAGGYYSRSDNFVAVVTHEDGSVATLTYTSLGSSAYPKERCEIYCDGAVLALDDFRETIVYGAKAPGASTRLTDKGHLSELRAFARAIKEGGEWPNPWWQQVEATRASFLVDAALRLPAGERERR